MCKIKNKKPMIQSVERALDIIELVCGNESEPMRAIDIAAKLDLKKNTAHNLIRTLYNRYYLIQDSSGRYLLGPKCYTLWKISDRWKILEEIARPIIKKLSKDTGDNTYLGVESEGSLLMIAFSKGSGTVLTSIKQKWLDSMYYTGTGRIIIAYKGLEWFKKMHKINPYDKMGNKTAVDFEALDKEVKTIRKQKYVLHRRESEKDVMAISVPVIDMDDNFLASLSQTLPAFYITSKKVDVQKRAEILLATAKEIGTSYSLHV